MMNMSTGVDVVTVVVTGTSTCSAFDVALKQPPSFEVPADEPLAPLEPVGMNPVSPPDVPMVVVPPLAVPDVPPIPPLPPPEEPPRVSSIFATAGEQPTTLNESTSASRSLARDRKPVILRSALFGVKTRTPCDA
jgi:hypothetical protein